MTLVTCEPIWLKQLFKELKFEESFQMYLVYATRLHYTLFTIMSFMKGPNVLRWIAISQEKNWSFGDITTRLVNSNEQSPSLQED